MNTSLTDNGEKTGLILKGAQTDIYGGTDYLLSIDENSFICVAFQDNSLSMYLDGKEVGSGSLSSNFTSSDLQVAFFENENTREFNCKSGTIDSSYIQKAYLESIIHKLDPFDLPEKFKEYAYGTISLPHAAFPICYTPDSDLVEIHDDQLIIHKNYELEDKQVIININASIDGMSVSKELTLNIPGNNKKAYQLRALCKTNNTLRPIMAENEFFPATTDGYDLDIRIISGHVLYDKESQTFQKTEGAAEKETAEIEISIAGNKECVTKRKVVFLDPYYAHLLVYFDGHDGWPSHETGEEHICFALSRDLNDWETLKIPKIKAKEGTKRFRDPYIGRDKDGNFLIVATEGYSNPGVYLISSKDLVSFDTKLVNFTATDKSLGLAGERSWAPEFFYNDVTGRYTFYYSDPTGNSTSLFASDTYDLDSFSYPYIFYKCGFPIIDGDLETFDGYYYMVYKDETESKIRYAVTLNPEYPAWESFSGEQFDIQSEAEGPFLYTDQKTGFVYLYADEYKINSAYRGYIIKDGGYSLASEQYFDESLNQINPRHFSIIPLTEAEYMQLKKANKVIQILKK